MSARTRQDWILWAQLGCALVATAHAEYTLVAALGQSWIVAGAVTGALDLYVVRALQKHKDVLPAVLVMVAANIVSILISHDVVPVHWAVLAAVGALAPLLVWRGHRLRVHAAEAAGAVSAPEPDEPEYEDDTCDDDECTHPEHECAAPEYQWLPDFLAEQVHPSAPELPGEYAPALLSAPALMPGDHEYTALAQEYTATTGAPSVRGLKAYAGVGQARAERLLKHLGVRS